MIHLSLGRKTLHTRCWVGLLSPLLCLQSLPSAEPAILKPLLALPDKIILQEDYSLPKPLAPEVYSKRQGTQWAIEDGVLRGRPSPPEFQAKKQDHQGLEARISIPACPREF